MKGICCKLWNYLTFFIPLFSYFYDSRYKVCCGPGVPNNFPDKLAIIAGVAVILVIVAIIAGFSIYYFAKKRRDTYARLWEIQYSVSSFRKKLLYSKCVYELKKPKNWISKHFPILHFVWTVAKHSHFSNTHKPKILIWSLQLWYPSSLINLDPHSLWQSKSSSWFTCNQVSTKIFFFFFNELSTKGRRREAIDTKRQRKG